MVLYVEIIFFFFLQLEVKKQSQLRSPVIQIADSFTFFFLLCIPIISFISPSLLDKEKNHKKKIFLQNQSLCDLFVTLQDKNKKTA